MSKQPPALPEAQKSKVFYLVVDEKRSNLFHMILNQIRFGEGASSFMFAVMQEKLGDELTTMAREIMDKEHEMGWCTDPKCKYDEEKDEDEDTEDDHA